MKIEKKKSLKEKLEIIKAIVGILAGVTTIAYRIYQFLKG